MTPGYSATPLFKKLGLKPGMKVLFLHPPVGYPEWLGEIYETLHISSRKKDLDFIHIFVNERKELEQLLDQLKPALKKDGMIWVSWYKKAARLPSEISEDIVRSAALSIGLVDVKVCAVDVLWSGLKLVYRLKDR